MDPNGQHIAASYAYYSSGDEGGLAVDEYGNPVGYAHQPVQHQYAMQGPNIAMPLQMQQQPHATYVMQHGPIALTQVQYAPAHNPGPVYHQAITSPPPPPSPYDPVSPAPSVSDHSASGTESAGAMPIRTGGVPMMPNRVYHKHSHSHSSQSSTSSLHGDGHPYPPPIMPFQGPDPRRHHSRTRSVEHTPPPNQYHGSDDDFDGQGTADPYVNQINLLNRKESTRRQRIQAEQRRRDELRDCYTRLKDVLPTSGSKSSKVSLIERARSHIIEIDNENSDLKQQIEELKREVHRLQQLSEQIGIGLVGNATAEADGETSSSAVDASQAPTSAPADASVAAAK